MALAPGKFFWQVSQMVGFLLLKSREVRQKIFLGLLLFLH
jgi:hypothetical protein